ncbi:MAG: AAA family ATPase, partial [Planctomycetes bacterium]|nr:AAA family ATPase [Planctomycetota bacterium]
CAGLCQAVLYDLSLPYEGLSEQEMRLKLTDFLLINFAESRRTVLVVDEAQHLTPELLEELRLWGNLESRQGRALQIILAAQPGFADTLRRPELAGFRQRLVVRITLEAFTRHEAADYLVHQLRAAGGKPEQLLSEEALEVLARGTQGVPRLLNQAGHQALALACQAGTLQVDAEVALEALNILGLSCEETPEEGELGAGPIVGGPAAGAEGEEPAISEFSVEEESQKEVLPERPEPATEELAGGDLNVPRQSA